MWGGAYNLSRAVLAGVLAAGCLMPGFAEAAPELETWPHYDDHPDYWDLEPTQNEYTVTIQGIKNDGLDPDDPDYPDDMISINWVGDDGASVEGCKINVNYVNSTDTLTITPKIDIIGGYVANGNAKSNTVDISNVKFEDSAYIYGGFSNSDSGAAAFSSGDTSGDVTKNEVKISGNTTFERNYSIYGGKSSSANANENRVSISGGTFGDSYYFGLIFGGCSDSGEANGNSVSISSDTISGSYNINGFVYGGRGATKAEGNSVSISGGEFNGDVYGGYGKTANGNSVIISGGNFDGGYYPSQVTGGHSAYGTANGNSVIISGGRFININVHGGRSMGTAEDNSVIISGVTINGNVWG